MGGKDCGHGLAWSGYMSMGMGRCTGKARQGKARQDDSLDVRNGNAAVPGLACVRLSVCLIVSSIYCVRVDLGLD